MPRYAGIEAAHVWNSQAQESGENSNGQFYFTGRTIYSYGSHFPIAWIAPDGAALFNSASYSNTTSKHQSYARRAASNRPYLSLPDFKALWQILDLIGIAADKAPTRHSPADLKRRIKAEMRGYIKRNAAELAERFVERPTHVTAESAGAYLTRLAGLPAASWPALLKQGKAAAAREARETAKAERLRQIESAKRVADMSRDYLRGRIGAILKQGNPDYYLKQAAKEARLALETANRESFSAKRVESIRSAKRQIAAALSDCKRLTDLAKQREQTASDIKQIRVLPVAVRESESHPVYGTPGYKGTALGHILENGAIAAERLSKLGRFPFQTRRRLSIIAERSAEAGARLKAEYLAAVSAEREREAQRRDAERAAKIAAWRRGESVPGLYFDAPSGGAAIRIVGDTLQTSHGASVPLSHAVRVFRFVKLCRESGRPWRRNGKTIRVGHFTVDSIDAAGNFVAGCHSFAWPEIESAARQAGVFDVAPDDAALEPSGRAA